MESFTRGLLKDDYEIHSLTLSGYSDGGEPRVCVKVTREFNPDFPDFITDEQAKEQLKCLAVNPLKDEGYEITSLKVLDYDAEFLNSPKGLSSWISSCYEVPENEM